MTETTPTPEQNGLAIEVLKQTFIAKGVSEADATALANGIIAEALQRQVEPEE